MGFGSALLTDALPEDPALAHKPNLKQSAIEVEADLLQSLDHEHSVLERKAACLTLAV